MRIKKPFRARTTDPITGRRIWISAPTSRELEAQLHELDTLRRQVAIGTVKRETADRSIRRMEHGIVTLERAARVYLEREDLAEPTKENVRTFLAKEPELCALELHDLDARRVELWLQQLAGRKLAPATRRLRWRTLSAIVRHATLRRLVGVCPWGSFTPKIKGKGTRREREAARSVEELAALLDAARRIDFARARDGQTPLFLEAKIATCALLGLRVGELAGLRWSDVDLRAAIVTIRRQYDDADSDAPTTKHDEIDRLEMLPLLVEVLARHAAALLKLGLFRKSGPVFVCPSRSAFGTPRAYPRRQRKLVLRSEDLRDAVRLAKLPDVERWSPHSLRDSFVVLEAQARPGDLRSVQGRSRHRTLTSLVRYLRTLSRGPVAPGFDLPPIARAPELSPAPAAESDRPRSGGQPGAIRASHRAEEQRQHAPGLARAQPRRTDA
jgi:integrase